MQFMSMRLCAADHARQALIMTMGLVAGLPLVPVDAVLRAGGEIAGGAFPRRSECWS
jgi:hypothetical protein